MGRIIQQNNGKTTIYVTGEDFNNLSGTTDTYYVGVDLNSGSFEKKNPDGSLEEFGSGSINYTSVTYSELYNLFTGETLNPGSYYLINDFQTCYDQPDYDNIKNRITTGNYMTGNTEPLLLLAVSTTGFSPTVYSTLYSNDKITYDITWNTTEITSSPAKGRITERIDNFNNRTDYDHRSILFKRYRGYSYNEGNPLSGLVGISGLTGTTGVLYGNTGTTFVSNFSTGDIVSVRNLDPSFFEVISVESDSLAIISGVTINETTDSPYYFGNNDGIMSYYQPNINQNQVYEYTTFGDAIDDGGAVNNYIGNYSNLHLEFGTGDFLLANNVLLEGSFRNNTIGDGSYNNTFNDECDNNQIGASFFNNSTNDDFEGNIIGERFNNNYITSNFDNNRIGSDFDNNILIGGSFYRNNIGNDFRDNVYTSGDFQNNEIGNQFNNNKIYDDFYNNDIGNGYNNNESYSQFYRNLIGNGYNGNTIYSEFYENNIEHVFTNNTIGTLAEIDKYNFSENKIGTNFESNVITRNFRKNEIGYGFYNNNISGDTSTNRIGEQFENNTIYGDFYDNQIFNEFKGNITYQDFFGNRLDWGFGSNQFSGFCVGNTFGPNIDSNDFFGIVFGNTFKGNVFGNTIGDNFASNNIGFGFISNTIGDNFGYGAGEPQGNIIGNSFAYNSIGEYFYNNSIPDNFHDNEIGNYFQWNIINTNIDTTYFTLNYGNITGFSYTAAGTGATDTIHTDLTGTTNGHGVNATFDVEVSGGTVIGVSGNSEGRLYQNNDELTILGTQIGGVTGVIDKFSSDAVGKSGTTGSYTGITASGTGGENSTFDIDVAGDVVTDIYLNNGGGSYSVNETLTIVGSDFGGIDGVDDITITVDSLYSDDIVITVTGTTSGSSFYQHYTKQIFERRLGNKRVSFYDEDDILNVDSVYEISGYIPVYSQVVSFPFSSASFEFECDGNYTNNGGITNQTAYTMTELVTLLNNNFRQFGYFFDNNDGTIGLYINPSLKQQYCPSGTYTINVFNN
jgi:hypothetical protein